jgi:hypothetical protein
VVRERENLKIFILLFSSSFFCRKREETLLPLPKRLQKKALPLFPKKFEECLFLHHSHCHKRNGHNDRQEDAFDTHIHEKDLSPMKNLFIFLEELFFVPKVLLRQKTLRSEREEDRFRDFLQQLHEAVRQ